MGVLSEKKKKQVVLIDRAHARADHFARQKSKVINAFIERDQQRGKVVFLLSSSLMMILIALGALLFKNGLLTRQNSKTEYHQTVMAPFVEQQIKRNLSQKNKADHMGYLIDSLNKTRKGRQAPDSLFKARPYLPDTSHIRKNQSP